MLPKSLLKTTCFVKPNAMHNHIKLPFLLVLVFCFSLTQMRAQELQTNADGDKILVYPDGSWRYLEPGETWPPATTAPADASSQTDDDDDPNRKMTMKERDDEFAAQVEARRISTKKNRNAERMRLRLRTLSQQRLEAESDLATMKAEGENDIERLELQRIKIGEMREQENQLRKEVQDAEEEAEFYASLIDVSEKKRQKLLARYAEEQEAASPEIQTPAEPRTENEIAQRPRAAYAVYRPQDDVLLNPPAYECRMEADETDEFTGQRKVSTRPEQFFTYTRPEIRPYYKGKEHTVCRAFVTLMGGGIYVLSLEIDIASRTAQQEYGGIMSNGSLVIILLDGSTITVNNNRTDRGKYDAVRDVYTFRGNYQLPPKRVDDLIDGEIDKLRVVWEQGYDTYDIYNMDFLSNHLQCIKK